MDQLGPLLISQPLLEGRHDNTYKGSTSLKMGPNNFLTVLSVPSALLIHDE